MKNAPTPLQKLQKARLAIMSHKTWCLYSGLLMHGKLEIKELPMKTAATNGRDIYFDPTFIEQLTPAELRFVLLHENEHKALRQLDTYRFLWKANPRVANIAADFVVNIRLQDADSGEGFIRMPEKGCIDSKYRGWSTKQVFDDLMQRARQGQKSESGEPVTDGEASRGADGEASRGADGGGFDEHDYASAEAMTEEERATLRQEIDLAVRQGGLLAGKGDGDASRMLDDLLDSQIRWQEILAEFVKSVTKGRDNASWAKLNRRWVSSGLYLPSAISDHVGRLIVGIDASGSTWSGNQLEGFVTELVAIAEDCQPEGIDVLWWDTKVQSVQSFDPGQYSSISLELKIQGGGGTAPSCVTDWIKDQKTTEYVAAIMLSDGYVGGDWGEWSACGAGGELPVLWCLNQKGITAPIGQTLYCEGG